jgi:hypothetical protein
MIRSPSNFFRVAKRGLLALPIRPDAASIGSRPGIAPRAKARSAESLEF